MTSSGQSNACDLNPSFNVTYAKRIKRRVADSAAAAIGLSYVAGQESMMEHNGVYASGKDPDARSVALALMAQALELIDADTGIAGIAGAHLQLAIDSLWRGSSPNMSSMDLH